MNWEPQFRHFALAGIVATGFLSIPWQLWERRADIAVFVDRITQEPPAAAAARPSPYITAPGNRIDCPDARDGRQYNGWIMTQSDGNERTWVARCVYMSAAKLRRMR